MNTASSHEPTLSGIRAERQRAADAAAEARRIAKKTDLLNRLADLDSRLTSRLELLEEYKAAKEKIDAIAGNADLTAEQIEEVMMSVHATLYAERS